MGLCIDCRVFYIEAQIDVQVHPLGAALLNQAYKGLRSIVVNAGAEEVSTFFQILRAGQAQIDVHALL